MVSNSNTKKRINFSAALLFSLGVLATTSQTNAHTPNFAAVSRHVEAIGCTTDRLKDEAKCHFRGERGYGKMLALNALIKCKTKAICRRIKRNPCYNGLDRDVDCLNKRLCELNEVYKEIMNCRCGYAKDPALQVECVVRTLNEQVGCLTSALKPVLVDAPTMDPVAPHFRPNLERSLYVEPAELPLTAPGLNSVLD